MQVGLTPTDPKEIPAEERRKLHHSVGEMYTETRLCLAGSGELQNWEAVIFLTLISTHTCRDGDEAAKLVAEPPASSLCLGTRAVFLPPE